MTRFADGPEVEVSVSIDAPVEVVWDFVTDINLPCRFQDEFEGAEWLDEGPAIDARFLGRNRMGNRTWETTSWIVAYDPMSTFGWAVSNRDDPGATWTYKLASDGAGTLLCYHRMLGPGRSGVTWAIKQNPEQEEEIIAARDAEHREHMQAVLDGIKELAEDS